MIRKAWLFDPAALGLLTAGQWPDIRRFLKIKQLSQGQGHPENGRQAEPERIRTPAAGNDKAQRIRLAERPGLLQRRLPDDDLIEKLSAGAP